MNIEASLHCVFMCNAPSICMCECIREYTLYHSASLKEICQIYKFNATKHFDLLLMGLVGFLD